MSTETGTNMESLLREDRVFAPPADFAAKAHVTSLAGYEALYKQSISDPAAFWGNAAKDLDWFTPFTKVLEGDFPSAKWFTGGKLNLCYNAVDRHAKGARKNKVAILWEGEPGEVRKLTYAELHEQVQKTANALKSL